MENVREGVCFASGFSAGSVNAHIKESSIKDDVAVLYSSVPCNAAAVYTSNKFKADPLNVTKMHLSDSKAQAIIINSGNANAAAPNGEKHALTMTEKAASILNLDADDVLVASTGVIGQELPIEKICSALPSLELSEFGSSKAARAIMTTDTREKSVHVEFTIDNKVCRMGGIAKGSGMIHPNMGTMLCFITTDAAVSSKMLQKALSDNVKKTFNRISVDQDTSTNDMVIVMANGLAGNPEIEETGENFDIFAHALHTIMQALAIEIARDGEGASRLLSVTVSKAESEEQAETIAKSVACSSLLKAAMFGSDANCGRILCAMGYSDAEFDPKKVDVYLASKYGVIQVCKNGLGVAFDEEKAAKILEPDMIDINIELNEGDQSATCWGCDLTYEYVRINGDYRS